MRIVIVLAAISITLAATAPVSAQTDPYDNAKQCQKDYDSMWREPWQSCLRVAGLGHAPRRLISTASRPERF